ncbi:hypothetical protein BGX34_010310 [Mortierella sp. NVP85]|nr:hypothetical protein BGX34_010310 [Mortierella sp. NVP85]
MSSVPRGVETSNTTTITTTTTTHTSINGTTESTEALTTSVLTADLVQHCILFPTYATRSPSDQGSKESHDWNIRVRGWAFTMQSNRKKRMAIAVARKIAGVNRDDQEVNGALESRFGMFLANNIQGATFTIRCVGLASLASTTHMELAGDAKEGDDPTVNELIDDMSSTVNESEVEEILQGKLAYRASLEMGRQGDTLPRGDTKPKHENESEQGSSRLDVSKAPTMRKAVSSENLIGRRKLAFDAATTTDNARNGNQLSDMAQYDSSDQEESEGKSKHSSAQRSAKGISLVARGLRVIKNLRPSTTQNHSNASTSSLDSTQFQSQPGTRPGSCHSDSNIEESNVQSTTPCDIPECGSYPAIKVSSKLGGHFEDSLSMTDDQVQAFRNQGNDGHPKYLKLHAHHPGMPSVSHGIVNLIDPTGISIISDIDDTIKETNVTAGAKIILQNTFLKQMQEVKGMADVYKKWWDHGAAVHYVSNSPWQLIPTLLRFFHDHNFPQGSAHLRLHGSVIKSYFMQPGEHKRSSIRQILKDFPERQFILVGDSGEIDMEIYTEMALDHPRQIKKIFIRDITTDRLKALARKAPPTRTLSFTALLPKSAVFSRSSSASTTLTSTNTSSISSEKTVKDSEDNTLAGTLTASPEDTSDEDSNTPRQRPQPSRIATGLMAVNALFGLKNNKKNDEQETSATLKAESLTSSSVEVLNQQSLHIAQTSVEHGHDQSTVTVQENTMQVTELTTGLSHFKVSSISTTTSSISTSTTTSQSLQSSSQNTASPTKTSAASGRRISRQWSPTSPKFPSDAHKLATDQEASTTSKLTLLSTSPSRPRAATMAPPRSPSSAPHSPSMTPSQAKTPYDIWMERVETCHQQLGPGVLTLFKDAKELEKCPIIHDLFKDCYKGGKQAEEQKDDDVVSEQEQKVENDIESSRAGESPRETLLPERLESIPPSSTAIACVQ